MMMMMTTTKTKTMKIEEHVQIHYYGPRADPTDFLLSCTKVQQVAQAGHAHAHQPRLAVAAPYPSTSRSTNEDHRRQWTLSPL